MTGLATYNDGTAALDTMVLRPRDYCARLAKYMNNASTIRKLCIDTYATAPERDEIQGMIDKRIRRDTRAKHKAEAELRELEAEEEARAEREASERVVTEKMVRAAVARDAAYKRLIARTEAGDNTNPFASFFNVGNNVVDYVANAFGLEPEEIYGRSRRKILTHPRSVVVRALTEWGWSSNEIGKLLGGRDHSTILHSLKNTFECVKRDQIAFAIYCDLRSKMLAERRRRAEEAERRAREEAALSGKVANDAC